MLRGKPAALRHEHLPFGHHSRKAPGKQPAVLRDDALVKRFSDVLSVTGSDERVRSDAVVESDPGKVTKSPVPFARRDPELPILPGAEGRVVAAGGLPDLLPVDRARVDVVPVQQRVEVEFRNVDPA